MASFTITQNDSANKRSNNKRPPNNRPSNKQPPKPANQPNKGTPAPKPSKPDEMTNLIAGFKLGQNLPNHLRAFGNAFAAVAPRVNPVSFPTALTGVNVVPRISKNGNLNYDVHTCATMTIAPCDVPLLTDTNGNRDFESAFNTRGEDIIPVSGTVAELTHLATNYRRRADGRTLSLVEWLMANYSRGNMRNIFAVRENVESLKHWYALNLPNRQLPDDVNSPKKTYVGFIKRNNLPDDYFENACLFFHLASICESEALCQSILSYVHRCGTATKPEGEEEIKSVVDMGDVMQYSDQAVSCPPKYVGRVLFQHLPDVNSLVKEEDPLFTQVKAAYATMRRVPFNSLAPTRLDHAAYYATCDEIYAELAREPNSTRSMRDYSGGIEREEAAD